MTFFKKMKTGFKLISTFVIVALIAGIIGLIGIQNIRNINQTDTTLYEINTLGVVHASDASIKFQGTRYNALKMTVSEGADQQESINYVTQYMSDVDAAMASYSASDISDENRAIFDTTNGLWSEYKEMLNHSLDLVSSGNTTDALTYILNETWDKATSLQDSFDQLFNFNEARAGERSHQNDAAANAATILMIIIVIAGVLIAVLFGVFMTRSITKPIYASAAQLTKMGNGDQLDPMDVNQFSGEFRHMVQNMNDVRTALYRMLDDTAKLTEAAVKGQLSARADTAEHKGSYRQIVEGVNNILNAVVEPVNEARDVLEEMSKGNLNAVMAGDYHGDHAVIKNALNSTISTMKGYIGEISEVLGDMSNGNLKVEISSEYKGDFVELKDSINRIAVSFNDVLGEINTAAEQVSAGTTQVSDGSQEISQGASEQAASIEELTASITEIAEQTRQNAQRADQANDTSNRVKVSAVQGNEQMKALQQAMQEINESSSNISKIIKVIDDIAFQTNILALNAAVEAARAGIHGKGFAVVAEEVRNLAAKSAGAAKETTELIEGSIKKTEAGTHIANDTAAALENIVESVQTAVELVGEIAMASNHQATAIREVNKGIEQMSIVVQSNSATAEEAAAAAEELSGQAELLKKMVNRFELKSVQAADKSVTSPAAVKNSTKDAKPKILLSDAEFGKY